MYSVRYLHPIFLRRDTKWKKKEKKRNNFTNVMTFVSLRPWFIDSIAYTLQQKKRVKGQYHLPALQLNSTNMSREYTIRDAPSRNALRALTAKMHRHDFISRQGKAQKNPWNHSSLGINKNLFNRHGFRARDGRSSTQSARKVTDVILEGKLIPLLFHER